MKIDLSEIINKLELIQEKFNASNDPNERFALICSINHIAKNHLYFDEKDWIYQEHYKAILQLKD